MLPYQTYRPGTHVGSWQAVPPRSAGCVYAAAMPGECRYDPAHRLLMQVEALLAGRWVPVTPVVEWRGGPGAALPTIAAGWGEPPAYVRVVASCDDDPKFGFPKPTFTGV